MTPGQRLEKQISLLTPCALTMEDLSGLSFAKEGQETDRFAKSRVRIGRTSQEYLNFPEMDPSKIISREHLQLFRFKSPNSGVPFYAIFDTSSNGTFKLNKTTSGWDKIEPFSVHFPGDKIRLAGREDCEITLP